MNNGTLSFDSSQCGASDTQTNASQNDTAPQECAPGSEAGSTNVTAIASGIAVPLAVLLLASLAAVAVLLRQNRSLRKASQQGLPAEIVPVWQERAEGGKGQGQVAYSYSALNEMSDSRTPIESGGRSVAQELPAR